MPNKHKIIQCLVCEKWMLSDTIQRHGRVHKDLLDLPEEEIETELKLRHEEKVETERKRQKVIAIAEKLELSIPEELKASHKDDSDDDKDTHQRLLHNNEKYLQNIRIGKEISSILAINDIHEESLSKNDKEALRLYRNQRLRLDISEEKLRPWQIKVFNIIEEKKNEERKVFWVHDVKGNTGKSWFQNYVEAYYGYQRVFRCDLRIKHKDICNILRKRGLSTINIFMFNDARSTEGDGYVNCYRILEDIKDGAITSSKYDNDIIKVNTPNIVIVFSNVRPNKEKLSKDRWMIIDISN